MMAGVRVTIIIMASVKVTMIARVRVTMMVGLGLL